MKFEEMVAKAVGSSHAVATSSGTAGLHAALDAVGVKHGELVIVPTFTFIASVNSIAYCGAEPWLMDVSCYDWCLDPDIVRRQIEDCCEQREEGLYHKGSAKRVAAIMPVYTLGNIPDMKELRKIADEYHLPLVADAACAVGSTFHGTDFGKLADLSVLSFNGNKTITCGGGGAVVGTSFRLLEKVRHLTTTARIWPDYDFDMVGYNYRMTNIQAAVGCAQLERLEEFVAAKRMVREYYASKLEGLPVSTFPATDGSSCWFSGIVLSEESTLDEVKTICGKLKESGIEARPFWKPVHLQQPYKMCPKSDVSIAESLWQRIITLPCSTNITEKELSQVAEAVKTVIQYNYK